MEKLLLKKLASGGPKKLKAGTPIDAVYHAEVPREKWFEIRLQDEAADNQLEQLAVQLY